MQMAGGSGGESHGSSIWIASVLLRKRRVKIEEVMSLQERMEGVETSCLRECACYPEGLSRKG